MTEDHEHEAEPLEEDITSEPHELISDAGLNESEDEEEGLEPATSRQVEEAQTEDEDEFEDEEEPEDDEDEEEEEDEELVVPSGPAPKLERLQKILAQAGVASRRHAEELITAGRVQVNGQVVTVLGSKADPSRDHIRVDGKLLQGAERLRYFMLNKPKGYVTTVTDPEGRPTIMDFFTKMGERLYPVGRLDYLSEGLLLVTNDGELANGLTKAASRVEKTYLVKVSGQPDEEQLDRLREGGVSIEKGRPGEGKVRTAPARIRQVRQGDNPWYEVVLIEGRNRELRKMFEEIGHHVEKIRRVGYGPLVLDLDPGKLRELDPQEVSALRLTAEGKLKPRRMKTTAMLPKEAGRSGAPIDRSSSMGKESAEERERGFRPGSRGSKPPQRAFRPRTDKPFERDDRPRQSNREGNSEGYAGRRESRPPRRQDRGGNGQQDRSQRPFRRESGFPTSPSSLNARSAARPTRSGDRPQGERTERPAARSGRFSARPGGPDDRSSSAGRGSSGRRPFRSGPPREESRPSFQRPYTDRPATDRPARPPRPPRREADFTIEEVPSKQFRPHSERPPFKRSEERETRHGKRPGSGGRGFKRGPGQSSGRSFERPAEHNRPRDYDRPPRREGEAPAWRGKARPSSEGRERPSTDGRSKPAHGSKSGYGSKPAYGKRPPQAGAARNGERSSGARPSGFRPKSGHSGRPSKGGKRGGKRPGGSSSGRGRS
jgi:23S rRNA pseudouridine2605 synthase